MKYFRDIFEKYLVEYSNLHFHEIFFFDDVDIQNQLIGTHRSAIHEALNDPQSYLQVCNSNLLLDIVNNSSFNLNTMKNILVYML